MCEGVGVVRCAIPVLEVRCEGKVYLISVGERGVVRAKGVKRDGCAFFDPDATEKELVLLCRAHVFK